MMIGGHAYCSIGRGNLDIIGHAKPLKKFPKSPIRPAGSDFCSASCGECLNEH